MKKIRLPLTLLLIVVVFGALLTWWTGLQADRQMRLARLVAQRINMEGIQALSAAEAVALTGLLLTAAVMMVTRLTFRRREQLEGLIAEVARLQIIVQHARDPLLLMSLDGKIVEFNNAAEKLYGYSLSLIHI